MARLSHDMTEDEVRDEYEWMFEFMASMAEQIRGTKDVHSLAAYVRSLERENAELRELVLDIWRFTGAACKKYPRLFDPPAQGPQVVQFNAIDSFERRMRELGIEVG